jgi:two-component system response regulator YesN
MVDDEQPYVEMMAHLVEGKLRRPVHPFTGAEEALAGIAGLRPAVVVTDYFMPGMDGAEFIRRASGIVPDAAFIMISGHNLEPFREELSLITALKLRMQKPFGSKLLASAVLRVWPGDDTPAPPC